jgi:hypothetical protein
MDITARRLRAWCQRESPTRTQPRPRRYHHLARLHVAGGRTDAGRRHTTGRTRRRGHGVKLCWRTAVDRLALPLSGRKEDAPAPAIEACAAKHGPFPHREASPGSRDRAGTPRPGPPRCDRGRVALQTVREALQRGQRARRRPRPPRLEPLRLPGTEALHTAWSQGHGLREGGGRLTQPGTQRVVPRRQVRGLTPHQPGRLAWCAALPGRIGHGRTGRHRPRPRRQPLGLAELREGAEPGRPFASIAVPWPLLMQSPAGAAPSRPAVEPGGLVGRQPTGGAGPDRASGGSDLGRAGLPGSPALLGQRPAWPAVLGKLAALLLVPAPGGGARGGPCGGEQVGSRGGRRRRRLDAHGAAPHWPGGARWLAPGALGTAVEAGGSPAPRPWRAGAGAASARRPGWRQGRRDAPRRRSRAITRTPGGSRSPCARGSPSRCGNRATGWRRSRAMSTGP